MVGGGVKMVDDFDDFDDDFDDDFYYTLSDSRFYEHPESYAMADEAILTILTEVLPRSWIVRHKGMWIFAHPPEALPLRQPTGFKLHVACRPETLAETITAAAKISLKHTTLLKAIADLRLWNLLHDKMAAALDPWSYGKSIALYPPRDRFQTVAFELASQLQHFSGPDIFSDLPVPLSESEASKSVYYRYGAFTPDGEVDEDGATPFQLPAGVDAPFFSEAPEMEMPETAETADDFLLNGYRIRETIQSSAAGGVFLAESPQGETVIIKEGREDTCVDRQRRDSKARILNEYNILRTLENRAGKRLPIPSPKALFTVYRHHYLVMSYGSGEALDEWRMSRSDFNIPKLVGISRRIAEAVAELHALHISWGDAGPSNTLYNTTTEQIFLIDFELATDLTLTHHPQTADMTQLGLFLLWILAPVDDVFSLTDPKRFLNLFSARVPPLRPYIQVLHEALAPAPDEVGVGAELIASTLRQVESELSTRSEAPIDDAAPIDAAHIESVKKRIVDFCLKNVSPTRTDRFFPCAPEGFGEPLSVGYGAAGAALAFSELGEAEASGRVCGWIRSHQDFDQYAAEPGVWRGAPGVAYALAQIDNGRVAREIMERGATTEDTEEFSIYRGIAGSGLAAVKLYGLTQDTYFLDLAQNFADRLIDLAVEQGDTIFWADTNGRIPLGYLFGSAGCAAFLLDLAATAATQLKHGGRGDYRAAGYRALRFVEQHVTETSEGQFTIPVEVGEKLWSLDFAIGTAGIAHAFIRRRFFGGDDKDAFIKRLLIPSTNTNIPCVVHTPAPGIFHGLAGIGLTLINAFNEIGDADYLDRVGELISEVECFQIEEEEGVAFLGGRRSSRISCDLATGALGIAILFDRLDTQQFSDTTKHTHPPHTPLI